MKRPTISWLIGSIAIVVATGATASVERPKPSFEDMATSRVADLEASVGVQKADQDELRKIGKDFGLAYRLKSVVMRFKRPGMLRMEGKIGQQSALYIVNGANRFYSI